MPNIGDRVRIIRNEEALRRIAITISTLDSEVGSDYQREYAITGMNGTSLYRLDYGGRYCFNADCLEVVATARQQRSFQVGEQVLFSTNAADYRGIINFDTFRTTIPDFSVPYMITSIDPIRDYINLEGIHWILGARCLRHIDGTPQEEAETEELRIGSQVRIIRNPERLNEIGIHSIETMDQRVNNNYDTVYTIRNIDNSLEHWITLNCNTGYVYKDFNLEKVMAGIPKKKINTKEEFILPKIEEVEKMVSSEVCDKYLDDIRYRVDKIYSNARYGLREGSKIKKEFKEKLKKLFFGNIECIVKTADFGKEIVLNYLKHGADLEKELEIYREISNLYAELEKELNTFYSEELKKRGAILLNRENTLLFSEGSKDNCQSYFKEVENLLKNISAMH